MKYFFLHSNKIPISYVSKIQYTCWGSVFLFVLFVFVFVVVVVLFCFRFIISGHIKSGYVGWNMPSLPGGIGVNFFVRPEVVLLKVLQHLVLFIVIK